MLFTTFVLRRAVPLLKRTGEKLMSALIVLVFYVVAAALFLFGSINNFDKLIPEPLRTPLLLVLIVYGLVMAAWAAVRASKAPAAEDTKALAKAAAALEALAKGHSKED